MKVITVAAPKGGSCKTTTVCLLAVRAMQDGKNVCMLDLNFDQGSLSHWWEQRGSPLNPFLATDVEDVAGDVKAIRESGKFDWLIIDTPPLDMDIIEASVRVADCVIIPVRTSSLDITAIDSIVEMCRYQFKPYKFLLSAVDSKMPKLLEGAKNALVADGEIFAKHVKYLQPYITAMTKGRTGPELDRALQDDTTALWAEVQALAASTIKPTLRSLKRRASND